MSTNLSDTVPNGQVDEIDGALSSFNHESDDFSEENKRMKMDMNKESRETSPLPSTSYQSRKSIEIEIDQVSPQPYSIIKALDNSLVLREILRNFSTVELLRLRQVNTLWRDCASSILRRRRDNTLWFAYDPDCKSYKLSSDSFYIVQDEEGCDYTLKNLLSLLTAAEDCSNPSDPSSSSFPCGNFKFAEGSLIHGEIQQILRLYGKNIRGLTLDDLFITTGTYDSDDEEMEDDEDEGKDDVDDEKSRVNFDLQPLRLLLLEQAPNIEFLQISQSFQIPAHFPLFQKTLPPPALPNLRTLKINKVTNPESMQLVKELLDAAINIQNVEVEENYKLNVLEWFHSINRLDLIQDFHFRLEDPDIHPLGKVASFPLRLKRMEISVKCHIDSSHVDEEFRERENRNLRFLARILLSCQHSLEILRVNNPALYGLVPGLVWPTSNSNSNSNENNPSSSSSSSFSSSSSSWKNLKRLELYIHAYASRCRSDESFRRELVSFRQLFPNLSTVRIEGKGRDIFASHEVLSQVTHLEILEGYNTTSFMESMLHAFPNIEHLGLSRVRRLVDFSEAMWKFPELTTLELELLLDGRDKYDGFEDRQGITNQYPNLDWAFAGFSHAAVTELISKRKRDFELFGRPKHPTEIQLEPLTLTEEDLETLRETRSTILNCKKLRKLDISFYDGVSSTRRRARVKFDLMSEICDQYGFRALPNLEVMISIRPNDHPTDPYDNTDTESEPNSEVFSDSDDMTPAHAKPEDSYYDHDEYIKKVEDALTPISKFPNVRIVEAKYHDLSIFRT